MFVIQDQNRSCRSGKDEFNADTNVWFLYSFIAFSLFFVFGVAPWLIVNALFVEVSWAAKYNFYANSLILQLPILIDRLPEGYNIATCKTRPVQFSCFLDLFFPQKNNNNEMFLFPLRSFCCNPGLQYKRITLHHSTTIQTSPVMHFYLY